MFNALFEKSSTNNDALETRCARSPGASCLKNDGGNNKTRAYIAASNCTCSFNMSRAFTMELDTLMSACEQMMPNSNAAMGMISDIMLEGMTASKSSR